MTQSNVLLHALHTIGFHLPKSVTSDEAKLSVLCNTLSPLFEKSKLMHPQHSDVAVMLGLFTLHHEKLVKQLQEQQPSLAAMKKVIDDSLSGEHAKAFKSPLVEEFHLIMHIWLFIQGRMQMDYSLANDYAAQAGTLLSSLTRFSEHQLRCDWMESFYEGLNALKGNKVCFGRSIMLRFKRLFKE
ncbi:hypothetical protein A9264_12785 [Vibrio sp. UCD-FRSSP16_10]|uniref:hypothetical protein n=1 Tax=unclassified Vibrio TaxID=2614977 RepID=UPI0008004680|nr:MULTISPECIES: hypothetical protein [unclassified Vibrio]OBT15538.1 hypothetical protein A9260_13000 [Vibrio sp. UCD-FRSSP16_30]OBT20611.1 hypothetical protein A9264_12785 [Vibrio sp. UCD-FRSSP16_10]